MLTKETFRSADRLWVFGSPLPFSDCSVGKDEMSQLRPPNPAGSAPITALLPFIWFCPPQQPYYPLPLMWLCPCYQPYYPLSGSVPVTALLPHIWFCPYYQPYHPSSSSGSVTSPITPHLVLPPLPALLPLTWSCPPQQPIYLAVTWALGLQILNFPVRMLRGGPQTLTVFLRDGALRFSSVQL